MSISDTIQAMIATSLAAQTEIRWFLAALPQVVSTEVLGIRDPADASHITGRQQRKMFAKLYQSRLDLLMADNIFRDVPVAHVPVFSESLEEYAARLMDIDCEMMHDSFDAIDLLE